MRNRNNMSAEPDVEGEGAHAAHLMGRDILAAALLTIAAVTCLLFAWSDGTGIEASKGALPQTTISEHQR